MTGSGLNRYLFANVFKFESKSNSMDDNNDSFMRNLKSKTKKRKPATFVACMWLLGNKNKKMKSLYSIAEERISDQLDLVRFIRQQLSSEVHRRISFTSLERYLMRHQKR